jgi:hypothetical protein
MQVDAVEQRTGQTAAIACALSKLTTARELYKT